MDAKHLVHAFAGVTKLPIDVNDLLALLRRHGNDDDIEFIGADLDPEILQGLIKIWYQRNTPYGDPRRMVNVYYHRGHTKDWQRMICCKELLHIVDPEWAMTSDAEQVAKLAAEIGLPPEMQNPFNAAAATNIDRAAEIRAAAILLPWNARELMLPHYKADRLSLADIARQADLPPKYAGLVMHDAWAGIYETMTKGLVSLEEGSAAMPKAKPAARG